MSQEGLDTYLLAIQDFAKADQRIEDAVVQPARKHAVLVAKHCRDALQTLHVRFVALGIRVREHVEDDNPQKQRERVWHERNAMSLFVQHLQNETHP